MSSVLCFYLDGAVVQAVKANIAKGYVTVKEAHTFPHDELESYLETCSEKECILSCNTSSFYHDIIYLPQTAEKFYSNLVRAEVMKNHSDLTGFTFFYRIIGEATIDAITQNKISAFSYADEAHANFIALFHNKKKVIANLYAAPYTIFRLAASAFDTGSEQARIFIAPLTGEKLITLSEKNELGFIRKIPSAESGLLPADIQNINMTMDYCFQSLRVRVSEAVMLDPSERLDEPSPAFSAPFLTILPPALADLPDHIVRDYLAPLATVVHHDQAKGECDILSSDYISFKQHKNIFTAAIIINLVLMLLLGWLVFSEQTAIAGHSSKIAALRAKLGNAGEEIAAYKKLEEEIKSLENPIAFLNKLNTSSNPAAALAVLSPPNIKDYSFKVITLKKGENVIKVHLEGTIAASGYKETQTIFEGVVEQVKRIPGYSISSNIIDIKLKTFIIEAIYNSAGQQNK